MKNYTNWDDHERDLLKNPEFRAALKEVELEYQIARAVIAARIHKGLSQSELAVKLSTQQSVISRVENAKTVPSLSFLRRLATALDSTLQVRFESAK